MFHGTILLVRGVPGRGKSTLGELLSSVGNGGVRHLEADQFFEISGQYRFDPTKLHEAHRWCHTEALFSMEKKVPLIVVTNTFTTNWEMAPYIQSAKRRNYRYVVVTVEGSHSASALAKRNIHNCPVEVIEKMMNRWEQFTD